MTDSNYQANVSPLNKCPTIKRYLDRIGAHWVNMFTAAITVFSNNGYESDIARIYFKKDGLCKPQRGFEHLAPTTQEQDEMCEEATALDFPVMQKIKALANSSLPPLLKDAEEKDLFIFKDVLGNIEFIQVRVALENGDKRYVPQTYWSDGVWRAIEPEDGLPIYGMERVTQGCRLFLHEGAKAGRAAHEFSNDVNHPMYEFLNTGVHVGWCGGAEYIHKNRFSEINRFPAEVIIVPDNDLDGRTAAKQLPKYFTSCPVKTLILPVDWKQGWDFADDVPEVFEPDKHLEATDWCTEEFYVGEEERPRHKITKNFGKNWCWLHDLQKFCKIDNPSLKYNKEQFNQKFASVSHVKEPFNLMSSCVYKTDVKQMAFLPEKGPGIVQYEGEQYLNTYKDARIAPHQGNTEIFHEFLGYMFDDEEERDHVLRWIRTLYARPDIRMKWAILMISNMHGVGKSTILKICEKLIGAVHCSFPSDSVINSDFSGWIDDKRLVCINEIYSGSSFKVYNKLKTMITDDTTTSNVKHQANVEMPMRAHFIAASNSATALKIEDADRRWFLPKLPSRLWAPSKYNQLFKWMQSGGLNALAFELLLSNDFVGEEETAPRSSVKDSIITDSQEPEWLEFDYLMNLLPKDQFVTFRDLWNHMRMVHRERYRFFNFGEVRNKCEKSGWFVELEANHQDSRLWVSEEACKEMKDKFSNGAYKRRCSISPDALLNQNKSDQQAM